MCGRYYVATEEEVAEMREIIEDVARNLGASPAEAAVKTGEIFPTDCAPVLAPPFLPAAQTAARPAAWSAAQPAAQPAAWPAAWSAQSGWQWRLARWGFPHWQSKRPIINARSETAAEKPMFRRALQVSRCAVPAAGFFEWKRAGGKATKEKYLFRRADGRMLYMAGLVDVFRGEGTGAYEAFTILTAAANESVADIHDRMPVILAREELGLWAGDMAFVDEAMRRPGPELARIAA